MKSVDQTTINESLHKKTLNFTTQQSIEHNDSYGQPPFISEQISPIGQDKLKGRENIFIQEQSIHGSGSKQYLPRQLEMVRK